MKNSKTFCRRIISCLSNFERIDVVFKNTYEEVPTVLEPMTKKQEIMIDTWERSYVFDYKYYYQKSLAHAIHIAKCNNSKQCLNVKHYLSKVNVLISTDKTSGTLADS